MPRALVTWSGLARRPLFTLARRKRSTAYAVRSGAMRGPHLTVPDHVVAQLVARDLEAALTRWGHENPGPFYAVTLWVDEVEGFFAFNTTDQRDYERRREWFSELAEHGAGRSGRHGAGPAAGGGGCRVSENARPNSLPEPVGGGPGRVDDAPPVVWPALARSRGHDRPAAACTRRRRHGIRMKRRDLPYETVRSRRRGVRFSPLIRPGRMAFDVRYVD